MPSRWIPAALWLCAACSAQEATPVAAGTQEISRDRALLGLPGWRNEGALPTGATLPVVTTEGGTFHGWSLDLADEAEVHVEADDQDARLRVLRWDRRQWRLVAPRRSAATFEDRLGAGHYLVVVQADGTRHEPFTLTAACYGSGCPVPKR